MEVSGQIHIPARVNNPGTHWTGGWVAPGAGRSYTNLVFL